MKSLQQKISRRLSFYKSRLQVNNPIVGRVVEILGDRVRMDGFVYSVASPQITRGHKSTLAFGLHEMEERELIQRWLPSKTPILEFGGGLGVVSCLANSKLSKPERHVVVEANPVMAEILEKNRTVNGCMFHVLNRAIAYDCDHINLNLDTEFVGSTIKSSAAQSVAVPTTTATDLMNSYGFDEAGIICDIEGAELDLIEREFRPLGDRIRFVMAEMHPTILGKDVVDDLLRKLTALGFNMKQRIGDSVFLRR